SAMAFQMPMDRGLARAALRQYCLAIQERRPFKIRVLLRCSGELQINHQALEQGNFGRVALARLRVRSADPMLYHKSTCRDLYNETYSRAHSLQYDDALFFNERNELTEGCIHNVFIEKDGVLLTPPINCGLLPGVYRQNVLAK